MNDSPGITTFEAALCENPRPGNLQIEVGTSLELHCDEGQLNGSSKISRSLTTFHVHVQNYSACTSSGWEAGESITPLPKCLIPSETKSK